MRKIKLTDNAESAVIKMAEGNYGALNICCHLLSDESATIDPGNLFGGMGYLLHLDTLDIYGENLYLLYNDICGNNLAKFISLLKAYQRGHITADLIRRACFDVTRGKGVTIKVDELYDLIKSENKYFDPLNTGQS